MVSGSRAMFPSRWAPWEPLLPGYVCIRCKSNLREKPVLKKTTSTTGILDDQAWVEIGVQIDRMLQVSRVANV